MRFCLVSTQQHRGGGEILLTSFARHLQQSGHSVGWVVRAQSQVEQDLLAQGLKVLHSLQGRGRNWFDFSRMRELLYSWAPDALVMNDTHAVVLAGLASKFCRAMPIRLAFKHTIFPLRSKLKYRLLTDKVICVSEAAKQTILQGGLSRESVEVVYGGTEVPQQARTTRAQVRRELGVSEQTILLVAIGNLLRCKGHAELVSALARGELAVAGSDRPVRLVIAGEGVERNSLEQQIQQLGIESQVKLLGYRKDPLRLMEAADVIVHPSHAEGLCLTLIQAQMMKKLIVATAVGGAAEVLGVAESDSVVTPNKGERALVETSVHAAEALGKQSAVPGSAAECGTCAWIARPNDVEHLSRQIAAAVYAAQEPGVLDKLSPSLEATAARAARKFGIRQNSNQLADLTARLLGQSSR